jgi:2-polyprenyl-6-methoxyphenol hydroxylase-like FAD-dependent oxidoreductase
VAAGRVVIVGAGPAGAALAYLLARRGVEVALLERHSDFARIFRGDGLQPSGMDAFDQMGLGDRLRQLPGPSSRRSTSTKRDGGGAGSRLSRWASSAALSRSPQSSPCSPTSIANTRRLYCTWGRRSGT